MHLSQAYYSIYAVYISYSKTYHRAIFYALDIM